MIVGNSSVRHNLLCLFEFADKMCDISFDIETGSDIEGRTFGVRRWKERRENLLSAMNVE